MDYLTVPEAAEVLRVHEETVRRWLQAGRLKGSKLPGRGDWRVPQSEIDRVLGTLEVGGE